MADVPDQPVARRVEDIMERDGELDDAKTGTKMTAGDRHDIDGFGPQFRRDLGEVRLRQPPQIGWRQDRIEKRGLRVRGCRHVSLSQAFRIFVM